MKKVVCGAGHYPERLALPGLSEAEVRTRLVKLAGRQLERFRVERLICGMAPGWDQALALAAVTRMIPVVAAVPYSGYEAEWSGERQELFGSILDMCSEVHFLGSSSDPEAARRDRNRWMVERSERVLALWDGSREDTTWQCLECARELGRSVTNLWPEWSRT